MNAGEIALGFPDIDGICFAVERGRLANGFTLRCRGDSLGPFLELLHCNDMQSNPVQIDFLSQELTTFYEQLHSHAPDWTSVDKLTSFLRTQSPNEKGELEWIKFGLSAQQAAIRVGFETKIAAQFVGAIGELRSNIYDHSGAVGTGLVAFRAAQGRFEFVVLDKGVGLLESLRTSPDFLSLSDHAAALEKALTEGQSRFGTASGHGYGFRPIFVGLANLNGDLRFRTGNYALIMEGQNRLLPTAKFSQKAVIDGFLVSISLFK